MIRRHYYLLIAIKAYYDTKQQNYVTLHLYVNAWLTNERHLIPTYNFPFNRPNKRRIRVINTSVLRSEGLVPNTVTVKVKTT
jgi:hypothetical protein